MTSGRARSKGWLLVFERRTAPVIEPLMGYTGSGDTLTRVKLDFPTVQAAIDYAERQGLAYTVQASPAVEKSSVESSDAEKRLQEPEALYASPMDVVSDPLLSADDKRAILRNWAWNEYLVDLATAEGMPENARPHWSQLLAGRTRLASSSAMLSSASDAT